ncbi:MFS transporter [Bacillus thuringiensis]|nr:MFS transporter [Bacillus thuringiensis]
MKESSLRMYRSLALLIIAQVLAGSAMVMLTTVSGLIGISLAPKAWLATLPNSLTVFGTLLGILPFSILIKRRGWRFALLTGTGLGIFGSLLSALAISNNNFYLYLISCVLMGVMVSSVQYYIYAAADLTNSPTIRRHAISAMTSAGIGSALLGPVLVSSSTIIVLGNQYIGGFINLAAILCLATLVLWFVPFTKKSEENVQARLSVTGWRLMASIPFSGIVVATCAFGFMTLLMHATPISMIQDNCSSTSVANSMQWHFLAMYAPALITGSLMNRFGTSTVALLGVMLSLGSVWQAYYALTSLDYSIVLILVGVGWSFMYTAGLSMIVDKCDSANKARVQSVANFTVYTVNLLCSFMSAPLLMTFGYSGLGFISLIPIGFILLSVIASLVFKIKSSNTEMIGK